MIDIEAVSSLINGKRIDVESKSFPEEWLTVDSVDSAYKGIKTEADNFNLIIESFSSYLDNLKDNESDAYYPDILGNRTGTDALSREEAIGYYMLDNPNASRREAEKVVDTANSNGTDYATQVKDNGALKDYYRQNEEKIETHAYEKQYEETVTSYMKAYNVTRAQAEEAVKNALENGDTFEHIQYWNNSHQEWSDGERERAIEAAMRLKGISREEAESSVDEYYRKGGQYYNLANEYTQLDEGVSAITEKTSFNGNSARQLYAAAIESGMSHEDIISNGVDPTIQKELVVQSYMKAYNVSESKAESAVNKALSEGQTLGDIQYWNNEHQRWVYETREQAITACMNSQNISRERAEIYCDELYRRGVGYDAQINSN